ncbi:MAG: hypothetical protein NBV76_00760 [Candidatus Ochrobactrum gambitense]|nr:MAG: hypothetical protein NBV76_00760 [Candidatus Ochrobactrum gambitense]
MALQKFDVVSGEAGKLPDFRLETAHMQGLSNAPPSRSIGRVRHPLETQIT